MTLYHGTNEDIEAIDLTEQALRFLRKTSVEAL